MLRFVGMLVKFAMSAMFMSLTAGAIQVLGQRAHHFEDQLWIPVSIVRLISLIRCLSFGSLASPAICPEIVYQIMRSCWRTEPSV